MSVLEKLVVVLIAFGLGYWAGDYQRNNAWLAKQARADEKAKQDLEAEIARSRKAAETHQAEQQMLMESYSTLEGKFNAVIQHGPLVVFRAAAAASGVAASADSGGAAFADAGNADTAVGDGIDLVGEARTGAADTGAGLGLSLGAVWVWNSALTGADAPAGACGALDPTSEACAADSGISLVDAWRNHIANAKSCAADRLRHQRLIDYLNTSPALKP